MIVQSQQIKFRVYFSHSSVNLSHSLYISYPKLYFLSAQNTDGLDSVANDLNEQWDRQIQQETKFIIKDDPMSMELAVDSLRVDDGHVTLATLEQVSRNIFL